MYGIQRIVIHGPDPSLGSVRLKVDTSTGDGIRWRVSFTRVFTNSFCRTECLSLVISNRVYFDSGKSPQTSFISNSNFHCVVSHSLYSRIFVSKVLVFTLLSCLDENNLKYRESLCQRRICSTLICYRTLHETSPFTPRCTVCVISLKTRGVKVYTLLVWCYTSKKTSDIISYPATHRKVGE